VAKAVLESAVSYLAAEVGPKGIRVHAISPGPLATRAATPRKLRLGRAPAEEEACEFTVPKQRIQFVYGDIDHE